MDLPRLAIVCGAGSVSGKEVMAMGLAAGLREAGHPVEIITSSWTDGDFARRLESQGFPVHRMRIGFISATLTPRCVYMNAEQLIHWPGLLLRYRHFLQENNPHKIIHTNWHHLLLLWPFLRPDRDWFWVHESIPDKPQYRRVFAAMAEKLAGFITVSHATADALRRIGIADAKLHVIHNGLRDPLPDGRLPERSASKVRIGIAGQIGAWKGHEDLVEAFASLAPQFPQIELHIFGRGDPAFEASLKSHIAELGLENHVVWHGFVSSQSQIYSNLEICVVPSRSAEPFATVAIEAAYFGLPVVATRKGGLPEIVDDGKTGFLVEAGSPLELAERLAQLAGDATLRKEMGQRARKTAQARLGLDRMTREFLQVLS